MASHLAFLAKFKVAGIMQTAITINRGVCPANSEVKK